MANKNIACIVCGSEEMVRLTMKKTKRELAVCRECSQPYELDKSGNPIFDHDPNDIPYYEELEKAFTRWSDAEDIIPYNE